jgi:hypothetical protein
MEECGSARLVRLPLTLMLILLLPVCNGHSCPSPLTLLLLSTLEDSYQGMPSGVPTADTTVEERRFSAAKGSPKKKRAFSPRTEPQTIAGAPSLSLRFLQG